MAKKKIEKKGDENGVIRGERGMFQAGTKPPPGAGRPKGSPDKITGPLRQALAEGTIERIGNFFEHLDSLKGEEYCRAYTNTLKHVLPALQSVKVDGVKEGMSELVVKILELSTK